MIGIQLTAPGAQIVAKCLVKGLRINCTHDTVIRFMPPMIVTKEQIDAAVDAIDEVLGHGVGGLALSLGKSLIERAVGHAGRGPGAAAG
jgi:acetylornithine/succinyldiaminopimelate/putrescine aminotransferase